MEMPIEAQEVAYAENLLATGNDEQALDLLQELADAVTEFSQEQCQATDKKQWFSFENPFELLAYRQVEHDPRELIQVSAPFDRVYADLALAYVRIQRWEPARDALMQAVRWNPMNCTYRLDLAELFAALDDVQEFAALSASVIGRAADAELLGRAYANLGQFFLQAENELAAEGCRRLAMKYGERDSRVQSFEQQMEEEHADLVTKEDARVFGAVQEEGIATNPSAEIAVCLLMCASDAAAAGARNDATNLTLRARDLIGEEACAALTQLIRESDAELAQEHAKEE